MGSRDISSSTIKALRRVACRYAFTADEADDLVQDILLAALEHKRDCRDSEFFRWASAALRRRAKFIARTAGRRRRREAVYERETFPLQGKRRLPHDFIITLPPSLRTVAILVNAGLGRAEVAHLLALPDTALRQRVSGLRRAWARTGAVAELFDSELALRGRTACGLLRRTLKINLTRMAGHRFAIADPDGHQIFISVAHISRGSGNMTAANH